MAYEEDLIKKIKGGISAIKLKTVTPKDAGLGKLFTRLKDLNLGQYEELMEQYKVVFKEVNKQ